MFLESLSASKNKMLIPIKSIEWIFKKMDRFVIVIGFNGKECYEHFDCEDDWNARYEEIKEILNAE